MTRRRLLVAAGALSVFLLGTFLFAPAANARAGGGGGYSGGGGFSGGGSFGGGSYSGGGGYYGGSSRKMSAKESAVWLVIGIIFVILRVHGAITGKSRMERTIVQGAGSAKAHTIKRQLDLIRGRDPNFEVAPFLDRIQKAFLRIQEAWSDQDMTSARAFISDGVHERFALYIEMQKAMGLRNIMSKVRVLKADIVHVESDRHFDTVHVSLRATAVDQDVTLGGGKIVKNRSGDAEEFVEVWSFLRRPGAKTQKKPGLIEGHCPNCGASLQIMDAAKCESCDSWVNSGEYDWVLAEITQACEWKILHGEKGIPGMAELKQRDPSLNVQFLEDRASVMFWRWQIAHWEPDAKSLNGVAEGDFITAFKGRQNQVRSLYRNSAVGAVEVLSIEAGRPDDKAHVLVKWSAEHFHIKEGEAVSQGQILWHYIFVLRRSASAQTDARSGLRSLLCSNCGATPTQRSQPACEFCGTSFVDGSRQWVLTEVLPRGKWRPPTPMLAKKKKPVNGAGDWSGSLAPVEGLAVLVGAMILDGKIDPRELEFARAYANKHGVPGIKLDHLMSAARSGRLQVPTPKNAKQSTAFLRGVIQMCLADGTISKREMNTLVAFGRQLKMQPADIDKMINDERKTLYDRITRDQQA